MTILLMGKLHVLTLLGNEPEQGAINEVVPKTYDRPHKVPIRGGLNLRDGEYSGDQIRV